MNVCSWCEAEDNLYACLCSGEGATQSTAAGSHSGSSGQLVSSSWASSKAHTKHGNKKDSGNREGAFVCSTCIEIGDCERYETLAAALVRTAAHANNNANSATGANGNALTNGTNSGDDGPSQASQTQASTEASASYSAGVSDGLSGVIPSGESHPSSLPLVSDLPPQPSSGGTGKVAGPLLTYEASLGSPTGECVWVGVSDEGVMCVCVCVMRV